MQRSAFLVVTLATLQLAGCEAREGSSCRHEGAGRCSDGSHALICRQGIWQAAACQGPAGCTAAGAALHCDQRVARDGERCAQTGQRACHRDGRSALLCADATGVWTRELACLGPRGCSSDGSDVRCDDSLGAVGELCARAGQRACSADQKAVLLCGDGRFSVERSCTACTVGDAGVSCD